LKGVTLSQIEIYLDYIYCVCGIVACKLQSLKDAKIRYETSDEYKWWGNLTSGD